MEHNNKKQTRKNNKDKIKSFKNKDKKYNVLRK